MNNDILRAASAKTHQALWGELRDKVAFSLRDPRDAKYVANALMEWDDGVDLLRRIVAQADARDAVIREVERNHNREAYAGPEKWPDDPDGSPTHIEHDPKEGE